MHKWVLTQDKKQLVELYDEVHVCSYASENGLIAIQCRNRTLGYYSSENAKAVMQDLSRFLIRKGTLNDSLFTMPEDVRRAE